MKEHKLSFLQPVVGRCSTSIVDLTFKAMLFRVVSNFGIHGVFSF